MDKLTWLLSWRYIVGIRSEKNISVMLITCIVAIFIGSFALALVASIMNGFERATCQKLRSIHADIIMKTSTGQSLDFDKIQATIKQKFPEITVISPSTYKQVILQKKGADSLSNALFLKAIDPILEKQTTTIEQNIVHVKSNTISLEKMLENQHILIGKTVADELEIKAGDTVNLLYIADNNVSKHKINLSSHTVIVSGIFSTGIDEFDAGLVYGSFEVLHSLYPDEGIQQINISLSDIAQEQNIIDRLKKQFGISVFSWKDFYKPLVQALKLEKYAMIVILALIALVAIMNIISVIFMQIIKKRTDIALLLSMGMGHNKIQKLFINIGVCITTVASFAGLLAAYGIGVILQKYPFIPLPDTYYTSHLPIHMEWWIFIGVFLLMLIFSYLAAWIPSRNIKSLQAAHILRFEG